MRKNDRKSPTVNNSMATPSNMNLPRRYRGEGRPRSLEAGDTELQAHRGRSTPNLSSMKCLVTRSVAKSEEAHRLMENSISPKNTASKKPALMKSPSAGTVLPKTDERVNKLNKNVKCNCDPISQIGSVVDDDLDSHLFTGRTLEQTLLELDLLPDTLSSEKQIITEWDVTPEKSETVPTSTLKGFQTFDGSRFSPIEEAFFVLNSSIADLCANVVPEKVTETVYPEYNYPVNFYQVPEIWQRTSEESVSVEKCFTCTSEESSTKWSTYSSSQTSSVLQNAKRLADFEIPGMVRKIQALEEELMEVKQQNKKLERLLKKWSV